MANDDRGRDKVEPSSPGGEDVEAVYAGRSAALVIAWRESRKVDAVAIFRELNRFAAAIEGAAVARHRSHYGAGARRRAEENRALKGRARELWGRGYRRRLRLLDETMSEGVQAQAAGAWRAAESHLRQALTGWEQLGAEHRALLAHAALAQIGLETAATGRAAGLFATVRADAQRLGWWEYEARACVALVALTVEPIERDTAAVVATLGDTVRLLARARALRGLLGSATPGVLADGSIEMNHARLASYVGDSATSAAMFNIARTDSIDSGPRRAALMMLPLHHLLLEAGRADDAAQVLELLDTLPIDDANTAWEQARGRVAGLRAAQAPPAELLEALIDLCGVYEHLREQAVKVGDMAEFRARHRPPFDEAAELALELGRAGVALVLLERGKARTLLDLLGVDGAERVASPAAPRAAAVVELLAGATSSQDAAVVELLLGERALWAIVVRSDGALVRRVCAQGDDAWDPLISALTEGGGRELLDQPPLRRIAASLDDWAGAGTWVTLVPHGRLYAAPLHLVRNAETCRSRPHTSYLPNASALRWGRPGGWVPQGGVLVAGDPTQDLPHARSECQAVGKRLQVEPALGAAASAKWLFDRLGEDSRARLVHIACHAVFNPQRPDRSGLVLAPDAPGERHRVVTPSELAKLSWRGALVVLSACGTGRHQVRAGDELVGITYALLGAGVSAAVVSLWEVDDLAASLVMDRFYAELLAHERWSVPLVTHALATAQHEVRDRAGLPASPARHVGPAQEDAPRARGYADPWFWGSFAVFGSG